MRERGARLVCAALLIGGCASAAEEETAARESSATEVADWAAELPEGNPAAGLPSGERARTVEVTDEASAAGHTAYQGNCVPCHGEEGEGRLGIGPKLNSRTFLAAASDDYLLRTIARGREGTTMPAWSRTLERSEVESIIAYMRTWRDVEPADLDEAPAEGDAEAGGERFRQICAACHGLSGAGYMETSNGTGIGRAAFLGDVSNGYLRYIIEHGKSDTPMRPFGRPEATAVANLTDEEIENVITYLRANAW